MANVDDWIYILICAGDASEILIVVDDEYKRRRHEKTLARYRTLHDADEEDERIIHVRSVDRMQDITTADFVILDVAQLHYAVVERIYAEILRGADALYLTCRARRGADWLAN